MATTPDKQIEAIRQIYSALSRGDADAALSLFDANAFRIEFEGSPNSGSFRGLEALKKHFEEGRSTWAEGACNPVEFYPANDRVVVNVHVKVRLKNHSDWIDAHTTDGFAFNNNVVTEFHSFTTKQKALDWAGISLFLEEMGRFV